MFDCQSTRAKIETNSFFFAEVILSNSCSATHCASSEPVIPWRKLVKTGEHKVYANQPMTIQVLNGGLDAVSQKSSNSCAKPECLDTCKQLRLLRGRVGDSTTLVNSVSPKVS